MDLGALAGIRLLLSFAEEGHADNGSENKAAKLGNKSRSDEKSRCCSDAESHREFGLTETQKHAERGICHDDYGEPFETLHHASKPALGIVGLGS